MQAWFSYDMPAKWTLPDDCGLVFLRRTVLIRLEITITNADLNVFIIGAQGVLRDHNLVLIS